MTPTQDLYLTLGGILFCAVLGLFSFRRHFKKRETLKAPFVPWIIPAMGSIATAFMLMVHLVNLMGWETGR